MKAIVQATYGSTNVHDFRDIDKPEMADDEALAHGRGPGCVGSDERTAVSPTARALRATDAKDPGPGRAPCRARGGGQHGCDKAPARR